MNFANPHYFSAILDGITHRFVLVMECESLKGHTGYSPPRFTVGGMNGTRDPRLSTLKQLMEVGVKKSALQIPPTWVMAHQFLYIIHENTDEFGWQYRHQWPHTVPGPKDEPWANKQNSSSRVRRRIWMATVVPRQDLVRAKRYLAENLRVDNGVIKKQGELLRLEKGTLTKTWNKRKVVLYHNRLEFYSGNNKKGEVLLNDVEVRMLFENQCQGRKYAFSVRNATGSVGVLLDAEDEGLRRSWVMAIQYQLAITAHEMNFAPLDFAPPTGEYPDNRVLVSGDLMLQGSDGTWIPRHFQLLPRELVYFQDTTLKGRIFLEQAKIISEERLLTFAITTSSGFTFNLIAGNAEAKNVWINGIGKQIQSIENQKLKLKTVPKEEQLDDYSPFDRLQQLRELNWVAPSVDGESSEYLKKLFAFQIQNNPDNYEFSEELNIFTDPRGKLGSKSNSSLAALGFEKIETPSLPIKQIESSGSVDSPSFDKTNDKDHELEREIESMPPNKGDSQRSSLRMSQLMSTKSFLFTGESKLLDPKRNLINPRFMLASLKGVTHRFVLVLESEMKDNARREIKVLAPPRFTVGGPRASKDPRTVNLNQLIGVSNTLPEIQLPAGWFMLHQYIYIVQQNTDDFGWQYRSTWSDGPLKSSDEQWADTYDDSKFVRRRLWMTTVVKRDDMITGKKMVYEELNKNKGGEVIYQEFLFFYHPGPTEQDPDWHRRKVILYHDKMEFFAENNKIGEASLLDCEVQLLIGDDNMGHDNAFRIRHPNGSVDVILAADTRAIMLRWVKALKYQFAIITPDVNFEPFFYGPPTGELPESRVIICGELEVSDHATSSSNSSHKWEPYQLVLQERILLCYSRDNLTGRLLLDGAIVKSEEENEFILKLLASNLTIRFRAENPEMKVSWLRALKRQIQFIEYRKSGLSPVSDDTLSHREIFSLYKDPDWIAQEINYQEDELHMETIRLSYNEKLHQVWSGITNAQSGAITSPSSHAIPLKTNAYGSEKGNDRNSNGSLSHGQSIANIVAAGSAGVVVGTNLANYREDKEDMEADWADYSVYKPKEIADRQAGYVPTPNLSEHSGYSRRSEQGSGGGAGAGMTILGKTITETTVIHQTSSPSAMQRKGVINLADQDEDDNDSYQNRVPMVKISEEKVIIQAVEPPLVVHKEDDFPIELEFGDSFDDRDIEEKEDPVEVVVLAQQTDDKPAAIDDEEEEDEPGFDIPAPQSPIRQAIVMEAHHEDNNNDVIVRQEQHEEVTTTITTTIYHDDNFIPHKKDEIGAKVISVAEAYPELRPVPVAPAPEPARAVVPTVVLKPTTPKVVEPQAKKPATDAELYQHELFVKRAELLSTDHDDDYHDEDEQDRSRPHSATSATSATSARSRGSQLSHHSQHSTSIRSITFEDEKEPLRNSKSNHHIFTVNDGASNDPNDVTLFSNSMDQGEFYHKYEKSMELDNQKEYTEDPDAQHTLHMLDITLQNKEKHHSHSSAISAGTAGDSIKRNSLEEYKKKQQSTDEMDSFVVAAKNLRHVDEEKLNRGKDGNEPGSLHPRQIVQLRSVTGDEDDDDESNVDGPNETIYTTVKLRNVQVPNSSEKQQTKEEEKNILRQVKLRSIQSKVKMEIKSNSANLSALDLTFVDPKVAGNVTDANNNANVTPAKSVIDDEPITTTPITSVEELMKVSSVKSRIQLFEKSKDPSTPAPVPPITPKSSSVHSSSFLQNNNNNNNNNTVSSNASNSSNISSNAVNANTTSNNAVTTTSVNNNNNTITTTTTTTTTTTRRVGGASNIIKSIHSHQQQQVQNANNGFIAPPTVYSAPANNTTPASPAPAPVVISSNASAVKNYLNNANASNKQT